MNTQTLTESPKPANRVVAREEWLEARKALLQKEKELTRRRDELSAERRRLPWVSVDKNYVFDTAEGKKSLADLFNNRSQLIIYHFMLGPGWQEGCVGCSFGADHFNAAMQHLLQKDVNFVAVSRAPLAEIEAFKKRMGWTFNWVSSYGTDFNFDFHVSASEADRKKGEMYYNFSTTPHVMDELPGTSVFFKNEEGEIFHTYSSYGRGGEDMLVTYYFLDLTPKGREENDGRGSLNDWVRHHDKYEKPGYVDETGRYHETKDEGNCCH